MNTVKFISALIFAVLLIEKAGCTQKSIAVEFAKVYIEDGYKIGNGLANIFHLPAAFRTALVSFLEFIGGTIAFVVGATGGGTTSVVPNICESQFQQHTELASIIGRRIGIRITNLFHLYVFGPQVYFIQAILNQFIAYWLAGFFGFLGDLLYKNLCS